MSYGTRRDAASREAELRLELAKEPASPAAPVPSFLTFLSDEYLPHAELRLKPDWLRNQSYTLVTLAEHVGDLPLSAISATMLEEYARQRLTTPSVHQKGTKELRTPRAVTINNELRVLRRVLAYAVERGHIAAVPKVARLPERGERRVRAWTEAELARLLDAAVEKSSDILGIIVFLANTGCRRGEALALKWENVDLGRRLVQIWPWDEWQPKSGRPREIPISDALLPWLERPRTSPYVFPTTRGRRKGSRYAVWPAIHSPATSWRAAPTSGSSPRS